MEEYNVTAVVIEEDNGKLLQWPYWKALYRPSVTRSLRRNQYIDWRRTLLLVIA